MCVIWLLFCIALATAGYFYFGGWGVAIGLAMAMSTMSAAFRLERYYQYKIGGSFRHWLRTALGWGFDCAELARRLGLKDASELTAFKPAYHEVFIPKKNGAKRRLLVPDDKTKALQRLLLRRLLKKLHVHPAAHGFVKGRSAVQNAGKHAGQAVVISMDVIDFFPSTQAARVEKYFRRIGWNREAAQLLTRLTTWDGGLPQGAPTSPALSNLVNYYLDVQITKAVARKKGTYTRYADDITISYPLDFPRTIQFIMEKVKRLLKSKGYRVHSLRKRRVRRQHQRQYVTGLVVNVRPQLTREQRRWLRAVKHRAAQGTPATLDAQQLQGWISHEHAIALYNQSQKSPAHRLADNRKVIRRRKRAHAKAKGEREKAKGNGATERA